MNSDVFVTIIIPAAAVESARELAATIPGGAGMFTAALSPTGSAPATHYISSGYVSPEIAALFECSDLPPQEAMDEAGLRLIIPSLEVE